LHGARSSGARIVHAVAPGLRYLDANDPTSRAISHFETELARIAGVHDEKRLKADPAFALGNLFGRLPLSRTPLLKTLAAEAKSRNSSK